MTVKELKRPSSSHVLSVEVCSTDAPWEFSLFVPEVCVLSLWQLSCSINVWKCELVFVQHIDVWMRIFNLHSCHKAFTMK